MLLRDKFTEAIVYSDGKHQPIGIKIDIDNFNNGSSYYLTWWNNTINIAVNETEYKHFAILNMPFDLFLFVQVTENGTHYIKQDQIIYTIKQLIKLQSFQ